VTVRGVARFGIGRSSYTTPPHMRRRSHSPLQSRQTSSIPGCGHSSSRLIAKGLSATPFRHKLAASRKTEPRLTSISYSNHGVHIGGCRDGRCVNIAPPTGQRVHGGHEQGLSAALFEKKRNIHRAICRNHQLTQDCRQAVLLQSLLEYLSVDGLRVIKCFALSKTTWSPSLGRRTCIFKPSDAALMRGDTELRSINTPTPSDTPP